MMQKDVGNLFIVTGAVLFGIGVCMNSQQKPISKLDSKKENKKDLDEKGFKPIDFDNL